MDISDYVSFESMFLSLLVPEKIRFKILMFYIKDMQKCFKLLLYLFGNIKQCEGGKLLK